MLVYVVARLPSVFRVKKNREKLCDVRGSCYHPLTMLSFLGFQLQKCGICSNTIENQRFFTIASLKILHLSEL